MKYKRRFEIAEKRRERRLSIANTVINAIMAIATVVVVIIASMQTRIADDTVRVGRDAIAAQERRDSLSDVSQGIRDSLALRSFELQNRPYLIFTVPIADTFKVGSPPAIRTVCANRGHTPALGMVSRSAVTITKTPLDRWQLKYPKLTETPSVLVVGPNMVAYQEIRGDSALTAGHIRGLKAETHHLIVFGRATYSDMWGNSYVTNFCFYYDLRSKSFVGYHKFNDLE